MNVYRRFGDQIGTTEARELAQQLVAWHDAMVKHLRVVGPVRTARCGEDCPHAEAAALWPAVQEVFGERASTLGFLRTHGRRSRTPIPASAGAPMEQPV
jgi:hypothetical protein